MQQAEIGMQLVNMDTQPIARGLHTDMHTERSSGSTYTIYMYV